MLPHRGTVVLRALLIAGLSTIVCLQLGLVASAQEAAATTEKPAAKPSAEAEKAPPVNSQAPVDSEASEDSASKTDTATLRKNIEQRIASLDATVLGESDFRKINEFYQQALNALGKLEEQTSEVQKYERLIGTYDDDLAKEKQSLESLATEQEGVDTNGKLNELEAKQQQLETEVQATRTKLAAADAQPKDRSARLAELPKLMLETQQQLDEAISKLEALPVDSTNLITLAERTALETRRDFLDVNLKAMEKQRQYYQISGDLPQTRRDHRAKKLARLEKQLATIREVVGQRRMTQAKQQAAEAAEAAEVERPEAIAALAKNNSVLAQKQAEIVAEIDAVGNQLVKLNNQLETVKLQFSRSEQRIEGSGMNESIGLQLRQQQELLPNTRELSGRIAQYRKKMSEASYRLYELRDQRSALVDIEIEEQVAKVLENIPAEKRATSEKEVHDLLQSEQKILDSMIENYEKYSNELTALIAVGSSLIAQTQEYANYITKNVLWIRSCTVPGQDDIEPALGRLKWSLDPQHWRDSAAAFWRRVERSPVTSIAVLGAIFCLIYWQDKLRRKLREIGTEAEKRTCTDFSLSLKAALVTLLLALPWPALIWFVGWWLGGTVDPSEFTHTLSRSLPFTAVCLLLLEVVRHVCRPGGLADSHFSWPKSCVLQIRRAMRVLLAIGLPLVFWLSGLEIQSEEKLWSSTLGRLWFVVLMLLSGLVLVRLLLVRKSPFRQLFLQHANKGAWRASVVWIPLLVGTPAVLTVLTVVGYYYTAQQLALRLLQMAALGWVLGLLGGLTRRWILLNRRALAREQARQKRAAALVAAESTGEQVPPLVAEISEDTVDLYALGQQTNRLVQTLLIVVGLIGVWIIWGDISPALSKIGEQSIPGFALTWGKLIHFLIVIGVTCVAVGNVPALLEFAVLQHLPLDGGLRYAITSLCRYVLVAIGICLAYTSLGFDSTSIQWLVAAMGVGLGFGLQEIFANFVSGVILLFERPIRVGDIITLGDKTGQVNRIRMRATTIVDWDRKEYVVPNKDLVTERLLNWTLSDQTNRIVIEVGVAYGSDTDQACQLLIEAANEHPLILKDPPATAVFDKFGDSTLNLTLRCFLPGLENRLNTIHDLHTAVDKKFRTAEIEIAFPQLDLHVQSVPEKSAQWAVGSGQNGN